MLATKIINIGLIAVAFASLMSCDKPQEQTIQTEQTSTDYKSQAIRIAHENIIVDTHIDVPFRLESKDRSAPQSNYESIFLINLLMLILFRQ